jgi:hypothetical protein
MMSSQGAKFLIDAKGEVITNVDLEAIANGDLALELWEIATLKATTRIRR